MTSERRVHQRVYRPVLLSVLLAACGLLFLTTYSSLALGAEPSFWEMTSAEMKKKMNVMASKKMTPEERVLWKKGCKATLESRVLAEQYFSATGDARIKLAGEKNANAARNVPYDIFKVMTLQQQNSTLPQGDDEKMWKELFLRELTGPYEGVFLAKPLDGKPMEKFEFTFDIDKNGKRKISSVKKIDFDAVAYVRDIERVEMDTWARSAFRGNRRKILSLLPLEKPDYLPEGTFVGARAVSPLTPTTQPTSIKGATLWKGRLTIFFTPAGSQYGIAESFCVDMEKKGKAVKITKCKRDEEFARQVQEKVRIAKFVAEFVEHPEKRAKLCLKGGADRLPEAATVLRNKEQVVLDLRETKLIPTVSGMSKEDAKNIRCFELRASVAGKSKKDKPILYDFELLMDAQKSPPYRLLYIVKSLP